MKESLRRIWVVFKKEVLDNLRDKRSVYSSLLTPIFMPFFMIALIMVAGRTLMNDAVEQPLDLPVAGAEYAPGLMAYMKENNVNILPAPADPRLAVREGEVNLVLVIGPDYEEAFRAGRPAPVQLVMDGTRQSASVSIERARMLLNGYSSTVGYLRLYARGVNPEILSALSVEREDISTPEDRANIFLYMLPFLLTMTIFVGGMYVIIDTTAGERERGSLEALLINPVPRRDYVLGKLLASLPFAVCVLALTLALFGLLFTVVPLENYLGMQVNINGWALYNIFWLSLPVVLLASALQMVVASFTRSFKEAQTYLPFLPLVAGLPSAFMGFIPVKTSWATTLVPIFSQSVLINQLLRGETVQPQYVWFATLATLFSAAALTLVAIRLYQREQILFGGR